MVGLSLLQARAQVPIFELTFLRLYLLFMEIELECFSGSGNLKVGAFYSTQNGTGLGRECSGAGGQDRVGIPCANQEILGPICHIQFYPWLQPCDGYL